MTQGLKYNVDIVLVIDSTGSMGSIIERVKESALSFYEDVTKKLSEKNKKIDNLRVKVIGFRDYYVPGEVPMMESEFFSLPAENMEMRDFIKKNITASGGGDEPETSLEALANAIRSNWTKEGDRQRHIVVVWTDASAHPLEKEGKPPSYPSGMPKNLHELTDLWDGQNMSRGAKRIIFYTPNAYPWAEVALGWENAMQFTSKAGEGLGDHSYSDILEQIANSV